MFLWAEAPRDASAGLIPAARARGLALAGGTLFGPAGSPAGTSASMLAAAPTRGSWRCWRRC
ncbi:hypothetical protein ACFQU2_32810 [Siccirubricoccus deserti]